LNEKEAIEKATADAFIELYNREMRTSFSYNFHILKVGHRYLPIGDHIF